jgi:hypothetical protein
METIAIIIKKPCIIVEIYATIEENLTLIMEKYPKFSIIVEKDQQLW